MFEVNLRICREMENIKVYGISKIAKNVIEISDHISEAVRMLKNRSDHSEADLKQL
jgi:molecular chaperone GrpE (heat shock protein)